jgi:SHS2 domain-containing protein
MDAGFELTEHTADVGIRACGPTRADVFEQAALAMFSLICDPAAVEPREDLRIVLTAESDDLLLAAWLNELLFIFESRRFVFAGFEVNEVGGGRLWARARGEMQDDTLHEVRAAVKAATYHGLELRRTDGGWEGVVILDV